MVSTLAFSNLVKFYREQKNLPIIRNKRKHKKLLQIFTDSFDCASNIAFDKRNNIDELSEEERLKLISPLFYCIGNESLFVPQVAANAISCLEKLVSNNYFLSDKIFIQKIDIHGEFTLFDCLISISSGVLEKNLNSSLLNLEVTRLIQTLIVSPVIHVVGQKFIQLINDLFFIILYTHESGENCSVFEGTMIHLITIVFQSIELTGEDFTTANSKMPTISVPETPPETVGDNHVEQSESSRSSEHSKESSESDSDESSDDRSESLNKSSLKGPETSIKPSDNAYSEIEIHETKFSHEYYLNSGLDLIKYFCRVINHQYVQIKTAKSKTHCDLMIRECLKFLSKIVELMGDESCSNVNFIRVLSEDLFASLMKSLSSSSVQVFSQCLQVFLLLVDKIKNHAQLQVALFIEDVLLNTLNSSVNAEKKKLVIQSIRNVFKNFENVIFIFASFDCSEDRSNIMEKIVEELCKISKNISHGNDKTPREVSASVKSLECLVSLMLLFYENIKIREDEVIDNTDGSTSTENESVSIAAVKGKKSLTDGAVELFNDNPKKAVRFLLENNLVDGSPGSVAKFLLGNNRLCRVQIGNYLGEFGDFELQVMYAYVEQFDFKNMEFLLALRKFLSNFWLPGEAQKIDRIIEKFASHYIQQNPEQTIFKTADVAYIVAYSVIILTTDLHNSQVKRKITLDQYIYMNSGINDTADLPKDVLRDIYESIKRNPIHLSASFSRKSNMTESNLKAIYESSIKKMEEVSLHSQRSADVSLKPSEIFYQMFQVVWKASLSCFAFIIQTIDDPTTLYMPLSGFRICIRIATLLSDKVALNSFLSAMINFSHLSSNYVVSDINLKHVDTFKLLLSIAVEDGDYIGEQWTDIMMCISHMDLAQKLHLSKTRAETTIVFESGTKEDKSVTVKSLPKEPFSLGSKGFNEEAIKRAMSQNLLISLDRVFENSVTLSESSILCFVQGVCKASLSELSEKPIPRTFMLQKIIEVADYNMNRVRIQWSRIWVILKNFFSKVVAIGDVNINNYCIVSLKQLAHKFLEKPEFENFYFQKEFLKPFEEIFSKDESTETRKLILECIYQFLKLNISNIKSGWANVFAVISQAANSVNHHIYMLGLAIMSDIFNEILTKNQLHIRDVALTTLASFIINHSTSENTKEIVSVESVCFKERYMSDKSFLNFEKIYNYSKSNSNASELADFGEDSALECVLSKISFYAELLCNDFITESTLTTSQWQESWNSLIETLLQLIKNSPFKFRKTVFEIINNLVSASYVHFDAENWRKVCSVYEDVFEAHTVQPSVEYEDARRFISTEFISPGFRTVVNAVESARVSFNKETFDILSSFFFRWLCKRRDDMVVVFSLVSFELLLEELLRMKSTEKWDFFFDEFLKCYFGLLPTKLLDYTSIEDPAFVKDGVLFKAYESFQSENSSKCVYRDFEILLDDAEYEDTKSLNEHFYADYSKYTCRLLAENALGVLKEKLDSTDENIVEIYNQMAICQFQREYSVTLSVLLTYLTENLDVTNSIMKIECLKDILHMLYYNLRCLIGFNDNKCDRIQLCSFIKKRSETLKKLWGSNTVPNLYILEYHILTCYANVVGLIWALDEKFDLLEDSDYEIMIRQQKELLKRYFDTMDVRSQFWSTSILLYLGYVLKLSEKRLNFVCRTLYDELCELVSCPLKAPSRSILRDIFRRLSPWIVKE